MDVNELGYEELLELAKSKAPVESGMRTVDVDGFIVHVNDAATRSWKAFDILSEIGEDLTPKSLRKMFEFIGLVTDVDEQKILEYCGGELALFEDVVVLASKIAASVYPKN